MSVRTVPHAAGPAVSVVLPVRNEGAHLQAVLEDLLAQELGDLRMEVLVVDGASDDDTVARAHAVAQRDPRVRVLANPRRLSSAARALGASHARGRYVLYVDGHCRIASRTLVADLVDLFERTGADCLARPQPLVATRPGLGAVVAAARASPFGHALDSTIHDMRERPVSPVSAGAAYRAEVFARVGSFDPDFDACEDVEFNWRVAEAGLRCWTSPRLAVAYEPRGSLRGLARQMVRYGAGRARLHRKHPRARGWGSLLPAAFVAGLPVLLAAPWLPAPWGALVAAPYALYLLLCLGASVAVAARRGWRLLPWLPVVFLTIHVGLGAGYLAGLWRALRPARGAA
jgi:GT2 family glycosyltransferase